MLSNRLILLLVTAIGPALWGTTYLVTTELLPPGRPVLAAVIRALPAGLLLVAISRRLPQGSWWWRSAVLGALNIGAFNALLFVAAYRLPGGVAATVGAVQPLVVGLLSIGLLGQRLTLRTALSAIAGVAGVSLLVLRANAQLDGWGIAAALGGAVVMSVGVVLSKRWPSPAPILATTGWQLVAGGLLLVPITLLVEGPPPSSLTTENVTGYLYLTLLGTAVAYVLYFRGLRKLPPTQLSFLLLLSPLVATIVGWLALDQRLSPVQLLGALIVLTSLVVAQGKKSPKLRITIFGASGATGTRIAREALHRGHQVTVVGRDPDRLREFSEVADVRRGDASDPDQVAELSAGQDLVISATRPAPGYEGELAIAAKGLVEGVARTGTRLLLVGGAASLTIPGTDTLLVDGPDFPEFLVPIATACNEQLEVVRAAAADVDWTYLSPPAQLEPGERTGRFRLGTDELLVDEAGVSAISLEDFAIVLLDEAEQPRHRRTRFTAAY